MQLNKVLKGLMIALPIMAVAACSSNKNNDQNGADSSMNQTNSGLSAEELARQQMQELQNNNIVYFGFDKYNVSPEYADMLMLMQLSYVTTHLLKLLLKVMRMSVVLLSTTSHWVNVVLMQLKCTCKAKV